MTPPPAVDATSLDVDLDNTEVLRDVHLRVDAAQSVAVLGGNGSGKTTLLRAVLGLVPHLSGQVNLFGQPLAQFTHWARIGYVPQHGAVQVGNATISELVASGRLAHRRWFTPLSADDKAAISDALTMVDLGDIARQPMAHLSGGQRQRALIARALATRPELVVLDEPLAGLDTATQEGLAVVLGRLKAAGTAILVVLHELGPLEPLLDSCTVLNQGRVVYDGPLRADVATSEHPHAHDAPDAHAKPVPPRWPQDPITGAR